jgi:hypothetical protein
MVYSFQVKGISDKIQNKSIFCLLLSKNQRKAFSAANHCLKVEDEIPKIQASGSKSNRWKHEGAPKSAKAVSGIASSRVQRGKEVHTS